MNPQSELHRRRPARADRDWRAVAAAALVGLVVLAACGPDPASPRAVAARFLDTYFGLDLAGAMAVSAHRAHDLVEEERRLTAGQAVDSDTRVPTIRYRLLDEVPGGDGTTHLVYAVRIAVPDADTSEQRWHVTVGRVEATWKVVNFERVP